MQQLSQEMIMVLFVVFLLMMMMMQTRHTNRGTPEAEAFDANQLEMCKIYYRKHHKTLPWCTNTIHGMVLNNPQAY
jgi:hypothetical protein